MFSEEVTLLEQLEAEYRESRPPAPDLGEVLRAGRRRRRLAALSAALATVLVLGAGSWAVGRVNNGSTIGAGIAPSGRGQAPPSRTGGGNTNRSHPSAAQDAASSAPSAASKRRSGAGQGGRAATYRLWDFSIRYPYRLSHLAPDPGRAEVRFKTAWSGKRFPGDATCWFTLTDKDGNVVDREPVSVTSDQPYVRDKHGLALAVSGRPAHVRAHCGPGSYLPGPGYTFDFVGATHFGNGRSDLEFATHWVTPVQPSTRVCSLTVFLTDGERRTFQRPFTMDIGRDGQRIHLDPPIADPASVQDAAIRCRELRASDP